MVPAGWGRHRLGPGPEPQPHPFLSCSLGCHLTALCLSFPSVKIGCREAKMEYYTECQAQGVGPHGSSMNTSSFPSGVLSMDRLALVVGRDPEMKTTHAEVGGGGAFCHHLTWTLARPRVEYIQSWPLAEAAAGRGSLWVWECSGPVFGAQRWGGRCRGRSPGRDS